LEAGLGESYGIFNVQPRLNNATWPHFVVY
jgi:hypothetical protein